MYDETVRTASARRRPNAPTASASGESARRSGEPYRRVAVRQSPCSSTITFAPRAREPHERRLVRALRDDRDRPVLAREAAHAQRQQRVEERPVERARRRGDEPEGAVVLRAAVRRRREHAQVEALPRAPRTSAPGSARAAARSACARRGGAAASRHRASTASTTPRTRSAYSSGVETQRADGRERALAEPPRELEVGGDPLDRGRERAGRRRTRRAGR